MAKLYVIAGHGAGDCGAVGNGFTEAERVRALANELGKLGGNNVTVLDTTRDWYADNGISSLTLPSSAELLELHLDSAEPLPCGGHVIVQAGLTADIYDNALADYISKEFPGRSSKIVYRSDLANPSRALKRGISYRMLETCFITNASDISKYNSKLTDIAKGILSCFGISTSNSNSNNSNVKKKGEITMVCFFRVTDIDKNRVYYFDGKEVHPLTNPDQRKILEQIYTDNNGGKIPEYFWTTKSPWYTRLREATTNKMDWNVLKK